MFSQSNRTLCFWTLGQSDSGSGLVSLVLFLVEPAEGEDVFGSVSVVRLILIRLNLQQEKINQYAIIRQSVRTKYDVCTGSQLHTQRK